MLRYRPNCPLLSMCCMYLFEFCNDACASKVEKQSVKCSFSGLANLKLSLPRKTLKIFVAVFLALRLGDKPLLKGGRVLAVSLTKQTHKLTRQERSGRGRKAHDTPARIGSQLASADW